MKREQQKQGKNSVLSDKEQFGKKESEDKLSHMGDKPSIRSEAQQKPQQSDK